MTIHRAHWIVIGLLGVWLTLTPIVMAGEGRDDFTIRITLSKTLVSNGESIGVTGSGAVPGVAVNVLIVPDPSSGANALTAQQVVPNAEGKFSATVNVPASATTGRYAVRAEQPPGNGALVDQYYWVGICVNVCTGKSLGSMLPETGGRYPAGASISLILSGLLVTGLAVRGVGRAIGTT